MKKFKKFETVLVVEENNYWNLMILLEAIEVSVPRVVVCENHYEITVVGTQKQFDKLNDANHTSINMKKEYMFTVKEDESN